MNIKVILGQEYPQLITSSRLGKPYLEKSYEYNVTLHHLFIDFKQAYDTIGRKRLQVAVDKMTMPKKHIRLIKMTE